MPIRSSACISDVSADPRRLVHRLVSQALAKGSDFRQHLDQVPQPSNFWGVLAEYLIKEVPDGIDPDVWALLVGKEIDEYLSSSTAHLIEHSFEALDIPARVSLRREEVIERRVRKLPITFGKYAYVLLDDVLKLFNPTQETQELPMEEKRNKQEEKSQYEPGMVVYLRSGGPAMTIELITGTGEVQVVWYGGNDFHRAAFDTPLLTPQKVDY